MAVFQAFSRVIHESSRKFVVVDTAPTGHTLLLLDATGSYHREIARQMGENTNFTTPLMRLQDPNATKVLLVTLAETTPVLDEAAGLQADLQRAGIRPLGVGGQQLPRRQPNRPRRSCSNAQPERSPKSTASQTNTASEPPSSRCSPKNPSAQMHWRR